MPTQHLDDLQIWFVANFRRDVNLAHLHLPDGRLPEPALTRERLLAWEAHAAGCAGCNAFVRSRLMELLLAEPTPRTSRTTDRDADALRRMRETKPSWEDMVE